MIYIGCVERFNRRLHGKNLSSVAGADDLPLAQITEEELQVYREFLNMRDKKRRQQSLDCKRRGETSRIT